MTKALTLRPAQESDTDRCFQIEQAAYPKEEAATKEKIRKRIQTYPEGFLILEQGLGQEHDLEQQKEIIGFINSGATDKVELSDEAFKELIGHDPNGKSIVIMSVVIHPEHQGKGFTNVLMRRFIQDMKAMNKTDLFLICKTELIDLYAKYGFVYLGESDSEHGGSRWHDMSLSLES